MPQLVRSSLLRGFGLFVLLLGHLAAVVYFYPLFNEQKGALLQLAEGMGRVLAQDAKLASLTEWGYFSSQQFFKFANTLGTGAAVVFAAGAVAGETQGGTLEIYLARPVSRARLFAERWLAGALALIVPLVASSALIVPLAAVLDVEIVTSTEQMVRAACYQSVFLLMFYSAAYAVSVFVVRALTVVLSLLFVTIGMYALYLVPGANEWSIYQWTDVQTFVKLANHWASPTQWARPTIGAVSFTALAWFGFRRRLPY
ncbi:ABC transporter permease subunit [Planctomycetes bacterium Pla163]|uniref:ABC transporter permease subunit n=1 Tax=Rohdeia mirabilis TaxID=2528008 RepID=UPI0011A7DCEA